MPGCIDSTINSNKFDGWTNLINTDYENNLKKTVYLKYNTIKNCMVSTGEFTCFVFKNNKIVNRTEGSNTRPKGIVYFTATPAIFEATNNYFDINNIQSAFYYDCNFYKRTSMKGITISDNVTTDNIQEINGDTSYIDKASGDVKVFMYGRTPNLLKAAIASSWVPELPINSLEGNILYIDNNLSNSSGVIKIWNGNTLVAADGYVAKKRKGATTDRPSLSASDAGFQFFDKTINKPIYWNGSAWVDATGATV